MKTIIMLDPVMEEPGSRFPKANITAFEAEAEAARLGARLPTSGEYDRLFAIAPWPRVIDEWTSTPAASRWVIRGGAWNFRARHVRAAYRSARDPSLRDVDLGFRLARDVDDSAEVPEGWIQL